jgi:hypothetical protein
MTPDQDNKVRRLADVVRSLNVEILQGNLTYQSDATGSQRVFVNQTLADPAMGFAGLPIYVVQGNNVFRFEHDEREEAEKLAESLKEALSPFSKSYRKKASTEIAELFADKPVARKKAK